MHARPVRHPQDLDALGRLFDECRRADGHAPIGEHKHLALVAGTTQASIARIFEDGTGVCGYAHLSPRRDGEGWVLEIAIGPDRRDSESIKEVLLTAIGQAPAGGGPIRVWVYHTAVGEALVEMGFRKERQLLQMRRSLPPGPSPAPPAGVHLASFRPDQDQDDWIEVNNRAFAGHPENGQWTPEILQDRLRQPWFDPAGLLMAWQGDVLIGFCWTKLHPGDLGEIYVVAVDPPYQGRSVGRWLTLEGLWDLHRRQGATTAMLYVDADNGPAIGLYGRLGFELDHIDRSYVSET